MLFFTIAAVNAVYAQEKTIIGKVVNQKTGTPVEGVTVKVKNGTQKATTDKNGTFTIKVPSSESVITVTHVGYAIYEVKAGTSATLDISLEELNNMLDDVIVVGYGSKKRVNVQGAVSTIKAADIEDLPVANLGQALIDRVPGVNVSTPSGKPGSTTTITIRNPASFSQGNGITTQPLYVIDGIVVNQAIWAQSPNPDFFENLDASQIEDITFLKDASAAIYGAAGAKGVVLITTKKGKVGKPKFSYSGYFGTSNAAIKSPSLTAYQHAKMLNDGYDMANNTSTTVRFSQAELDSLAGIPDQNWYDQLWQAGKVTRQTLNVSGGSDKITFFFGGNYYNEKGNYGKIDVNKYSIRGGVTAKILDGLTANLSFSTDYNQEYRNTLKGANGETDDLTIRALYLTPKWVPLSIDGIPTQFNGPNPPGNWSILGLFNSGNYTQQRSQGLSVNTSLEYKPNFLKGLTARVQFGQTNRNNMDKQYYPSYTLPNFVKNTAGNSLLYTHAISGSTRIANNDQLSEGTTTNAGYQLIGTLSYDKKFQNHDFSIMVGYDQSEAQGKNIFLTKITQLVAGIDEFWAYSNDVTGAASITDLIRNPQYFQSAKRSYLGRMNYSFKNRYFLEVIARTDASANFTPDHRWGVFPTVGLGWKISDENFFKDITFVNALKLRANYGLVGEDRVSNKTYVTRFTQTTGYLYGNAYTNGLDPNLYPNPDATWEKSKTFNVGFDASLFRNKITITAEFYQRYTYDAFNTLDPASLPLSTGLTSAVVNYGQQLSWGSEFAIGYHTNFGKNWGFNADVNFGWSNSQVLQQFYSPASLGLFGTDAISNPIGKDPRTYNGNNYGYLAKGILRTQDEVDNLLAKNPNYTIGGSKPQTGFMDFEDVNKDGKIDDNDVTLMFDRTSPAFSGGITLGVTYKEFKLQTNINLVIGGKKLYDSEARKVPTTTQNAPAFWADSWTPNNVNAKYPRADAPLAKETSDFWAVNGTQCRINNLVLSYSIPKRIVNKLKIPDARLMITGTNLWTIVNPFKYKDPYTGNFASYPTLRTISFGLNVSL
jgi:TonB-linked SusC/RagA family outer membrane protein